MTVAIAERNYHELAEQGFTVLAGVIGEDDLHRFEDQIAALVAAQLAERGLQPRHSDPFIDLFAVGGAYTDRLYKLLERLLVLQRMNVRIADGFERAGFFDRLGLQVPIVWPDIRADIPSDATRLLPVHQDYRSMQCARAYRLWIPLRPSNEELGSMCVFPGTHRQGPVPHELSDPRAPHIAPARYRECERVVFDLPAGDAVLLDPLLFHASVPNRSWRTKFTLMIQMQDLATMIDPDDGSYGAFDQAMSARVAAKQR